MMYEIEEWNDVMELSFEAKKFLAMMALEKRFEEKVIAKAKLIADYKGNYNVDSSDIREAWGQEVSAALDDPYEIMENQTC